MFSNVFGSLFSLFSGVSFSWNYALTANAIALRGCVRRRSGGAKLSRTKDIFEGLVIHHSLVLFVHRISDMTPALFSVYRPYIMFFALIDKFHQLLKVSETCFTYMCWLHKYNVLSTSADLFLYVQAIATHFIWVNCWQLFNKAIMQLVWRFEIQPLRMHIVSLVSG